MTKLVPSTENVALYPTIATVREAIAGWTDLKEPRRRDLASALSTIVQLDKRHASVVRLDPVRSLTLLESSSAEALGIQPVTLNNKIACVRYILRRFGLLAAVRIRSPQTTDPIWSGLLAALPSDQKQEFGRLRALIAFCAVESICPDAVDNATLDAYATRRAAESGGAKSRDHARRAGAQWNLAAKLIPSWPATRLGVRAKPLQYSLPFDAYPVSLQEEAKQYLADIGAPADFQLFSGSNRAARVKPSTVAGRKYCLRRLLFGYVQSGEPVESLTSLRQVPTPKFIMASLQWHFERAGGVNGDIGQLTATIASIANYLDLPKDARAEIKPLLEKASPKPRTEITTHVAELIEELCDPEYRARLLHLPAVLMTKAARIRGGWVDRRKRFHPPQPGAAAWLAATAVAVELLFHAPMRLVNLNDLRIGTELRLSQVSRTSWRGSIFVEGSQVKNERRLEVPLTNESIAVIREYLDGHRQALPGAEGEWLFPGQRGPDKPRHKGAFGQAITETITQYVGIRVNPHGFRAFAGALILEDNPHAIDDVRAILGHAGFKTALIYYRRNNQRNAAVRLSATLKRQRQSTKPIADAHFLATELRHRLRRV